MIEIIKKLRDQTGLSVADIKNALIQANGDEKKAVEILNSQGYKIVEKKASRQASQGVVESYIHSNRKIGAILILNCETDFVAKSADFLDLAHNLVMQIVSMNPETADELFDQAFIKDQTVTIRELINRYIAKFGENIKIGEFYRLQI